jgi:hypothetical protein
MSWPQGQNEMEGTVNAWTEALVASGGSRARVTERHLGSDVSGDTGMVAADVAVYATSAGVTTTVAKERLRLPGP